MGEGDLHNPKHGTDMKVQCRRHLETVPKTRRNCSMCRQCKSKQVKMCLCTRCEYHILSVGGGGMLMVRVPESSRTSTLSIRGRLDTSAIFFCMYLFSVAFLKYLDFAILPTNRRIFRPVLPPVGLCPNKTKTQMEL